MKIEIKGFKLNIPPFKWWQVAVMLAIVILALKVDPNESLELLNEIISHYIN